MNGSQIASEIDREYKLRKKYEERRAQRCKNKECNDCNLKSVCAEIENKND